MYLDDILVTGSSEEAHLRALEEVLRRLERARLKVKQSKCTFMRPSVTNLCHRIDAKGLHPLDDRVRAIEDAPTPTSVSGLKSYLGVLSYYNKFLPNLSSILHPIHRLLRKDTPWVWGVAQSKAFAASMKLLTSLNCLTHFDSSLELTLACDASNYGLGAVLSHKIPDGSEQPICMRRGTVTFIGDISNNPHHSLTAGGSIDIANKMLGTSQKWGSSFPKFSHIGRIRDIHGVLAFTKRDFNNRAIKNNRTITFTAKGTSNSTGILINPHTDILPKTLHLALHTVAINYRAVFKPSWSGIYV